MATLENIRKRGPLLVGAIGVALLAFIVGDFLQSGQTFLNRSRENVLVVGDEKVNIHEFQAAVEQVTEFYKIESNRSDFSEEDYSQIRASVWENLVSEKILESEAEKLGLVVSKAELSDRLYGNNIHPIILQRALFVDENGMFSRTTLLNFLSFLEQGGNANVANAEIEKFKNYWKYLENVVKTNILQEKYNLLLAKSITANSIDAKENFDARQAKYTFSYIAKPYYQIPDSVVSVSEREIKNRYNKNKEQYKQEDTRSADYVVLEVKPEEDDYKRVQTWMDDLSDEFRTTNDVIGLVNSNSDVIYDERNYSTQTVPANLKDFAFSAKEGDFYGPVFENDTHTMARLMKTGIFTSDSVRLSHIYLPASELERADSLVRVLNTSREADFETLAMIFSQVKETAKLGGDIGWIYEGIRGLDKDFLVAFDKKKDEIFTIKNSNGIQIIKVTDKTPIRPKVKLAILERKVEASNRTQAKIFNEAKQIASNATDLESLNLLAEEKGLSVLQAMSLDKNANRVANLPDSRQIVRWIFGNSINTVSDVFDCGDKFVVVAVSEINKEGYTPLEKVQSFVSAELLKEKKGVYLEEVIDGMSATKLDDLAKALEVEVKEANDVSFSSSQFGSEGIEPSVIGNAVSQEMSKISKPIKGKFSVFVVQPVSVTKETDELFDVESEVKNLNYRREMSYNSTGRLVFEDLKKKANVQDNRSNFY